MNNLESQLNSPICKQAITRAKAEGKTYIQLAIDRKPFDSDQSEASNAPLFSFDRPKKRLSIYAYGVEDVAHFSEIERFDRAKSFCSRLAEQIVATHDLEAIPTFITAFSFSAQTLSHGRWAHWPNSFVVLPSRLDIQFGDNAKILLHLQISSDSNQNDLVRQAEDRLNYRFEKNALFSSQFKTCDISRCHAQQDWQKLVQNAIDDEIPKIVVARCHCASPQKTLSPQLLARFKEGLIKTYPQCATFTLSPNPYESFLGATPETLIQLEGDSLKTMALAGTVKNRESANIRTPKLLDEQRFVIDSIAEELRPITEELVYPSKPNTRDLGDIKHLETPFAGKIQSGITLFDLAKALHPTPAVSGWPKKAAENWLDAHENLDRGLYAGVLGWVDRALGGDLVVNLRSALWQKDQLIQFAGAGITAKSNPQEEWQETELKLNALAKVWKSI